MWNVILTCCVVLQAVAIVYAWSNPKLDRFWAWLVLFSGLFNMMVLMMFFMMQFCMWGIFLECPVMEYRQ